MNESNQLLAAAPVPRAFFKLAIPAVDSALMMATANLRKWATAQNCQKGQNSRNKRKAPLCEGDSPQCGEMSRGDRGARPRKRSRKAGEGEI